MSGRYYCAPGSREQGCYQSVHQPAHKVHDLTHSKAMVIQYIERRLIEKSKAHRAELKKLEQVC